MKADLTRSTFRREKHYNRVLMQQGRVQLDADWNEQADIAAHLDETTRIDVIGRCGMPVHDAGFGVSPLEGSGDLGVSAGRAYVDGILCESEASTIRVLQLGDAELVVESVVADGRELREGEWVELAATDVTPIVRQLAGVDVGARLLKLGVPLDAAEQGDLEKAGDAVIRRLITYFTQPHFAGDPTSDDETAPEPGLYLFYLDVWQRHRTALEDESVREVALGGPDHATRSQTVWQVRRSLVDSEVTCETVQGWDELIGHTTGRLRARAHPQTTADDLCTVPPGAGFRRGENQLYRVEITKGGSLGDAEFTFSRENGSVAVKWLDSDTDTLTVTSVGRDAVLGIGPGDWIEVTDDVKELGGDPGTLVKVKTAVDKVITIDAGTAIPPGPIDIAAFEQNPRVRRWDDPQGMHVVERPGDNDGYLALEDGVEVLFEDGSYRALDYWLVPARTALGDVEWPEDSAHGPLARPPEGIAHHYCKLGLLRFDDGWTLVEDCRKLFPPLTELPAGGAAEPDPGVHVVKITTADEQTALHNDWFVSAAQLADGIAIHCDADVEPGTLEGKPTCLVTLDLPFPANQVDRELWGDAVVGTMPLTLAGTATASGATIVWKPASATQGWLVGRLGAVVKELHVSQLLVHLKLRGRFVYEAGDPLVNVDGEVFGFAQSGRLHALFKSGDGRRGGDLELWFRLRPSGGAGPSGLVLAVPVNSAMLTTKARQAAIPAAISAVLPRDELQNAIPDVPLDVGAAPDPGRARKLVSNQRFGLAGEVPTVVLAVEDLLAPAGELVVQSLEQNEVGLRVELETVSAAELVDRLAAGSAPDLLLVSPETLESVAEAAPGSIVADGAVVL
jgi:Family of unknown function (DUF6519)